MPDATYDTRFFVEHFCSDDLRTVERLSTRSAMRETRPRTRFNDRWLKSKLTRLKSRKVSDLQKAARVMGALALGRLRSQSRLEGDDELPIGLDGIQKLRVGRNRVVTPEEV